jgi:hypothetical protein
MKNYESPTIEQAGGQGNEVEPQITTPFVFFDGIVAAEVIFVALAVVWKLTVKVN